MFDVYCPKCAGRRLIFSGQIRSIHNAEDGIRVSFTCWCGAIGTWVTGKARQS